MKEQEKKMEIEEKHAKVAEGFEALSAIPNPSRGTQAAQVLANALAEAGVPVTYATSRLLQRYRVAASPVSNTPPVVDDGDQELLRAARNIVAVADTLWPTVERTGGEARAAYYLMSMNAARVLTAFSRLAEASWRAHEFAMDTKSDNLLQEAICETLAELARKEMSLSAYNMAHAAVLLSQQLRARSNMAGRLPSLAKRVLKRVQ